MSPLLGTAGGSPLVVHIPEHLFDVRSDHAFGMPGSGLTPGSAFLPLGIAHNPRLQLGFRRDTHTLSVPPALASKCNAGAGRSHFASCPGRPQRSAIKSSTLIAACLSTERSVPGASSR